MSVARGSHQLLNQRAQTRSFHPHRGCVEQTAALQTHAQSLCPSGAGQTPGCDVHRGRGKPPPSSSARAQVASPALRCAVRGTRTSLGAERARRAVPPDQPGGSWRRLGCEAQGPIPLAGPERIQAPGTQYPDALHPVLVPDSGRQGCPGTGTASGGDGGTRAVAHRAGPRGRWAWQGSGTMGASLSVSPGQPGPTCQAHPTPHLIGTGMSSSISASTSPLGACPQTQSPKPATEPAPRLPWQMRTQGRGRWDAPWQKFLLAEETLG